MFWTIASVGRGLTLMLRLIAAFALMTSGKALAQTLVTPTAVAQASPVPTPTGTPNRLKYDGYVRGYYFTRQNATGFGLPQTKHVLNQASFNAAVSLHAAYQFSSKWSIGGTYLYANPFNGCATAADQLQHGGPCSGKTFSIAQPSRTNPDNTLPAFALNTLYEGYVQYVDAKFKVKAGNQVIKTPWANASDTRLKPVAFQGADANYTFSRQWSGEVTYMDRFEGRTDSAFLNSTLLTATSIADASGAGSNLLLPEFSARASSGFGYARIGYADRQLVANAHFYSFADIANAEWFDAKWVQQDNARKPFIALQAGNEDNAGASFIGKINSQVVGIQAGITLVRNVDLTIGFDYIPQKSEPYPSGLPAGTTCTAVPAQPPVKTPAGNAIVVATGSTPFMYFLPTGGTPNCVLDAKTGVATVYYGGWASPYTDSYATDPLFTTSISQGMVDRRSAGTSGKIAATWYADEHQFRFIGSFALYAYGNAVTGVSPAHETDLDATYFFNKVGSGPYRGLSLRYRYVDRDQAFTQFYGGLPVFKYNRVQVEYAF